ncbi:hypothetical protein CYMTET_11246, partial [Cymbomonas tetramitiformis]
MAAVTFGKDWHISDIQHVLFGCAAVNEGPENLSSTTPNDTCSPDESAEQGKPAESGGTMLRSDSEDMSIVEVLGPWRALDHELLAPAALIETWSQLPAAARTMPGTSALEDAASEQRWTPQLAEISISSSFSPAGLIPLLDAELQRCSHIAFAESPSVDRSPFEQVLQAMRMDLRRHFQDKARDQLAAISVVERDYSLSPDAGVETEDIGKEISPLNWRETRTGQLAISLIENGAVASCSGTSHRTWISVVSEQVFSGPRTIRLQVNNAIDRFYIGLVDCSWEPDGIESVRDSTRKCWVYRANGQMFARGVECGETAINMTSGEFTAELRWDAAEGKLVYFKNGEHVGEIVDQGLRQTELRLVISFGRNIGQVDGTDRSVRILGGEAQAERTLTNASVQGLVSAMLQTSLSLIPVTGVETVTNVLFEMAASLPPLGFLGKPGSRGSGEFPALGVADAVHVARLLEGLWKAVTGTGALSILEGGASGPWWSVVAVQAVLGVLCGRPAWLYEAAFAAADAEATHPHTGATSLRAREVLGGLAERMTALAVRLSESNGQGGGEELEKNLSFATRSDTHLSGNGSLLADALRQLLQACCILSRREPAAVANVPHCFDPLRCHDKLEILDGGCTLRTRLNQMQSMIGAFFHKRCGACGVQMWKVKVLAAPENLIIGVQCGDINPDPDTDPQSFAGRTYYMSNGVVRMNGERQGLEARFGADDEIEVELNIDTGVITFRKNGGYVCTGRIADDASTFAPYVYGDGTFMVHISGTTESAGDGPRWLNQSHAAPFLRLLLDNDASATSPSRAGGPLLDLALSRLSSLLPGRRIPSLLPVAASTHAALGLLELHLLVTAERTGRPASLCQRRRQLLTDILLETIQSAIARDGPVEPSAGPARTDLPGGATSGALPLRGSPNCSSAECDETEARERAACDIGLLCGICDLLVRNPLLLEDMPRVLTEVLLWDRWHETFSSPLPESVTIFSDRLCAATSADPWIGLQLGRDLAADVRLGSALTAGLLAPLAPPPCDGLWGSPLGGIVPQELVPAAMGVLAGVQARVLMCAADPPPTEGQVEAGTSAMFVRYLERVLPLWVTAVEALGELLCPSADASLHATAPLVEALAQSGSRWTPAQLGARLCGILSGVGPFMNAIRMWPDQVSADEGDAATQIDADTRMKSFVIYLQRLLAAVQRMRVSCSGRSAAQAAQAAQTADEMETLMERVTTGKAPPDPFGPAETEESAHSSSPPPCAAPPRALLPLLEARVVAAIAELAVSEQESLGSSPAGRATEAVLKELRDANVLPLVENGLEEAVSEDIQQEAAACDAAESHLVEVFSATEPPGSGSPAALLFAHVFEEEKDLEPGALDHHVVRFTLAAVLRHTGLLPVAARLAAALSENAADSSSSHEQAAAVMGVGPLMAAGRLVAARLRPGAAEAAPVESHKKTEWLARAALLMRLRPSELGEAKTNSLSRSGSGWDERLQQLSHGSKSAKARQRSKGGSSGSRAGPSAASLGSLERCSVASRRWVQARGAVAAASAEVEYAVKLLAVRVSIIVVPGDSPEAQILLANHLKHIGRAFLHPKAGAILTAAHDVWQPPLRSGTISEDGMTAVIEGEISGWASVISTRIYRESQTIRMQIVTPSQFLYVGLVSSDWDPKDVERSVRDSHPRCLAAYRANGSLYLGTTEEGKGSRLVTPDPEGCILQLDLDTSQCKVSFTKDGALAGALSTGFLDGNTDLRLVVSLGGTSDVFGNATSSVQSVRILPEGAGTKSSGAESVGDITSELSGLIRSLCSASGVAPGAAEEGDAVMARLSSHHQSGRHMLGEAVHWLTATLPSEWSTHADQLDRALGALVVVGTASEAPQLGSTVRLPGAPQLGTAVVVAIDQQRDGRRVALCRMVDGFPDQTVDLSSLQPAPAAPPSQVRVARTLQVGGGLATTGRWPASQVGGPHTAGRVARTSQVGDLLPSLWKALEALWLADLQTTWQRPPTVGVVEMLLMRALCAIYATSAHPELLHQKFRTPHGITQKLVKLALSPSAANHAAASTQDALEAAPSFHSSMTERRRIIVKAGSKPFAVQQSHESTALLAEV